jgi:cyanosortase A-associated protein
MTGWTKPRQILVIGTFAGVAIATLYLFIDKSAGSRQVSEFKFPQTVPLAQWQQIESIATKDLLSQSSKSQDAILASQKYTYQQNQNKIEIEMHYTVGAWGEPRDFLASRFKMPKLKVTIKQDIRKQAGVGFYSVFEYEGRSHLLSCINPRGGSTVTGEQFIANRKSLDFQPVRFLDWMLGQQSLRDMRCLWVLMSVPTATGTDYPTLETAFTPWYQYWSRNFPRH